MSSRMMVRLFSHFVSCPAINLTAREAATLDQLTSAPSGNDHARTFGRAHRRRRRLLDLCHRRPLGRSLPGTFPRPRPVPLLPHRFPSCPRQSDSALTTVQDEVERDPRPPAQGGPAARRQHPGPVQPGDGHVAGAELLLPSHLRTMRGSFSPVTPSTERRRAHDSRASAWPRPRRR